MKRLACTVLLAVLTAGLLFAGGQTEKVGAGKMVLTLYNYRDPTAPDAKNWDELVAGFYAKNPDIQLEIEEGFNEPFHQKFQTMIAANQIPDLMLVFPGKRSAYATAPGLVKDLRPWLKGKESLFMDAAMKPQGPNGEIWVIPANITDTHVIYTNEKLLKSLGLVYPATMEQMLAQGDKIRSSGLIPIAMANKEGWEMQSCFLSALCERAGGMSWYTNAIKGKGASFADPEFVNALNVIKVLSDQNMFSPGINQLDYPQATQQFVQEQSLYYLDGDWKINEMVKVLTAEQKGYVTMNVFPKIPNQKGDPTSTAGALATGFGMHSALTGAKAEAAWKWIWFWGGPEGADIRMKQGILPSYKLDMAKYTLDVMVKKLADFRASHLMAYVMDAELDTEGMSILQPDIQEMMFGRKTPQQVARAYEDWVSKNDSARK